MGNNVNKVIELILQLGIDNLPMVTICACLWVLVNQKAKDKKRDK